MRSRFLPPSSQDTTQGHSIQAGWGGVQPGDLRFPGLPGGKEEHPLGLTGLVNLSKLDFLLGRGMDREQKKKKKKGPCKGLPAMGRRDGMSRDLLSEV